jgi:uncharacterized protein YycO
VQKSKAKTNTEEIEPGSIVLFYRPRGKEWLISFFTKSPYYHVGLMLNQDELVEAVPSGVVRTALAEKRNKNFHVIPPPSKEAASAAVRWAKSKIGDGYDPADLLAIALDRIFAHLHIYVSAKDRFTCGEFVAQSYKEAGADLIPDIEVEEVVPADFARLLKESDRVSG